MTAKPQRRLGRGIASLISSDLTSMPAVTAGTDERTDQPDPPQPGPLRNALGIGIDAPRLQLIRIEAIRQNPLQPRKSFDEAALQSLANSLKLRGTLQPIVVRPMADGFELIAGERRLRASKLAGITEIPAIIRPVPDEQMLELALIENIQRSDLNAIERAKAYKLLQDRYGLSHDQIGHRLGEDRATVANYIRLLNLPAEVQDLVSSGQLSAGHARALLAITDYQVLLQLARRVVSERWSVRRIEQEAAAASQQSAAMPARPTVEKRAAIKDMEQQLTAALGLRVTIKEGRKRHTGRLTIDYYSLDDFDRVSRLLGVELESA